MKLSRFSICLFFFFNDTATTEIYTLSLHDALPIFHSRHPPEELRRRAAWADAGNERSEEHTSELRSQFHLVCRLLLEKKKNHVITMSAVTEQEVYQLVVPVQERR